MALYILRVPSILMQNKKEGGNKAKQKTLRSLSSADTVSHLVPFQRLSAWQ